MQFLGGDADVLCNCFQAFRHVVMFQHLLEETVQVVVIHVSFRIQ